MSKNYVHKMRINIPFKCITTHTHTHTSIYKCIYMYTHMHMQSQSNMPHATPAAHYIVTMICVLVLIPLLWLVALQECLKRACEKVQEIFILCILCFYLSLIYFSLLFLF